MKQYNSESSSIMPLMMNFTVPSSIEISEPESMAYDNDRQISYDMRIVGTRSLKQSLTGFIRSRSRHTKVDKKNEIDDSKVVR